MKKLILVLVLAMVLAGGAFAEWYDSYAPGIDESNWFINGGIGIGFSTYNVGVPPISISADYQLPIALPITVGLIGTFSTWSYDVYYADITYTNFGIGIRGMYHFNLLRNLDLYAGVTLGYIIQTGSAKWKNGYSSNSGLKFDGVSTFLFGGRIGARYFFTDLIGAYLELGWDGLQVAGLGVSFKF